jgi:hypothetical protein
MGGIVELRCIGTNLAKGRCSVYTFCLKPVGTCSQLQGGPTWVNSDGNRVLAQDGNSSVNLASLGHCAGVFIGI